MRIRMSFDGIVWLNGHDNKLEIFPSSAVSKVHCVPRGMGVWFA